jgi:hypothetical protein
MITYVETIHVLVEVFVNVVLFDFDLFAFVLEVVLLLFAHFLVYVFVVESLVRAVLVRNMTQESNMKENNE